MNTMGIEYFKKRLTNSNLQKAGMKQKYITVPKKQVDPKDFFGEPPKKIIFEDISTSKLFELNFNQVPNGEYRLTPLGSYFEFKKPKKDDEIFIKKTMIDSKYIYKIDVFRNGLPISYEEYSPSTDEEFIKSSSVFIEGYKMPVFVNKYERNLNARRKCIEYYGAVCRACDFDFEREYGGIGKGFIHVHHLIPISQIGELYSINPIKDLIPVCPNCHAMIHKRKPIPFTIDEIKEKLNK
jgi:hypothetical protein